MKRQTGIWIDSTKAVIVTLNGDLIKTTEIKSNLENNVYHQKEGSKGTFSGTHHNQNESKFDERKKHSLNLYLKEVIDLIKDTDEWYLFGPAETKKKLEHKILEDKTLDYSKLKCIENAESYLSQNQVIAKVKVFYNGSKKPIYR